MFWNLNIYKRDKFHVKLSMKSFMMWGPVKECSSVAVTGAGVKPCIASRQHTVNSAIFARVLFSQNFAYAKFRENKILAKSLSRLLI